MIKVHLTLQRLCLIFYFMNNPQPLCNRQLLRWPDIRSLTAALPVPYRCLTPFAFATLRGSVSGRDVRA